MAAAAVLSVREPPAFEHPAYELIDGDKLQRRADAPPVKSRAEDEEEQRTVNEALVGYVTSMMVVTLGFQERWIPYEEATAKCPIYCTADWNTAPRLLIVLINQVGGQAGLWSRSLCFSHGLKAGTMLACLERAIADGYGVLVLNPNTNSVVLSAADAAAAGADRGSGKAAEEGSEAERVKVSIPDSASPEEHAMGVWENLVLPASGAAQQQASQEIYLLAYGNGASLAKTLIERNMARMLNNSAYNTAPESPGDTPPPQSQPPAPAAGAAAPAAGGGSLLPPAPAAEKAAAAAPLAPPLTPGGNNMAAKGDFAVSKNIVAVATIEASLLVENDDPEDIKKFIKDRFLNWEQPDLDEATQQPIVAPEGYRLRGGHSATRLGQCVRLSVGAMGEGETRHAAWSAGRAMDSIFSFFFSARGVTTPPGEGLGLTFARAEAARLKLNFTTAVAGPKAEGSGGKGGGGGGKGGGAGGGGGAAGEKAAGGVTGMLGRMMSTVMGAVEGKPMDNKLKVSDFDLLKVVGKGAFGKVMLVRKKTQPDKGGIFAMKVLKKSMIIAKGQVEHTASERSILHTIKHPYIVCLRYAFQSDEKLYLITDYYSGGSLFYHLRKARGFSENRARFYAAELLLALSHLHANHIIYRDLKLENVLMDHHGHIALTDFGLSKENVDDVFEMQLSTFCGTAEYIAPELLKGQKYGAAVDWWSFGVLLYEMLGFKTPFFDKNRKLMFYNIINNEPQWQSHFSERATSCLRGLLMKPPTRRLGSGVEGDREIKQHPFFAPIDFEKLAEKKLEPPFRPEVKNILDPKFVPKTYLNEAAHDSFDRNAKGATNVPFSDFTYQPDSVLDG